MRQKAHVLATVVYGETCSSTCLNIQGKQNRHTTTVRERKSRARGKCVGKHTCNTKQNLQGRYRSISRHTQPRGRHPQPVPINLEAHTVMVTSSHRVDGTTLESKSPTAKAEPINLKAHSPRVPQADLGWRRNTEQTPVHKCLADT